MARRRLHSQLPTNNDTATNEYSTKPPMNIQQAPVEGPLHEKLSRSVWKVGTGSIRSKSIIDDLLKPRCPLLQWSLLLQRLLEVLLQVMNDGVVASANPRRLLLHATVQNRTLYYVVVRKTHSRWAVKHSWPGHKLGKENFWGKECPGRTVSGNIFGGFGTVRE